MLPLQARLGYAMCNVCITNVILFMILHVSSLVPLRIRVVGTLVSTTTCSVFQASVFYDGCSTITFIWRNFQVSSATLSHVGWSHTKFRFSENEPGQRSACPSLHSLNSESTFIRLHRGHGPNNLISDLLLSERQGQRSRVKGDFASSPTVQQTICHSIRCPRSCLTGQRQSAYSHFLCQATPASGNAEPKKADSYHPIGTAVPPGIYGVYANFRFILCRTSDSWSVICF